MVLKQFSHGTASLVDTLPRYSVIRQHCPDIFCAAVGICAVSFSCNTLYETLTTTSCSTCSRSGTYLYLITCKRVCFFCFTSHADYMPVSSTKAAKATNLTVKMVKKQLPYIYSIPGRYDFGGRRCASRSLLFDPQAMLKARHTQRIQGGGPAVEALQHGACNDPRRYMSIITAPYFGPSIHSVDWGFYSHSYTTAMRPPTDFRDHYTSQGILDHIDQHHPGAAMQVVYLTEIGLGPGYIWNERLGNHRGCLSRAKVYVWAGSHV